MKKDTFHFEKATLGDYFGVMNGIRTPILFLILIFVMNMISAYAGINLSMFTGSMVDAQGDVPVKQLVSFALMYILIGVAAAGSVIFTSYASEKINLGLRMKLWRKIMYTPQSAYEDISGDALVSRVTTDCDYSSTLMTTIVEILSVCVSIVIYVLKMYRLSPDLSVPMLILIPVSVIVGIIYSRLRFLIGQKTQSMLAGTTSYLVERTKSINLIKTSGTKEAEIQKGCEHFDKQFKMQFRLGLMSWFYSAIQEIFTILSLLIPFVIGAKLVSEHIIKTGVVIAFYTIASSAAIYATNLINYGGTIKQANGALSRVIAILRLPDERKAKGLSMDIPDQDITVDCIDFSYSGRDVLHNMSCTIPKNKITALVGPNGSGKSTFFKLIDRLMEPDSGKIMFGNRNAAEYDLFEWRKAFCLVEQGSPMIEGTLRDNICYGCKREITEEELITVCKKSGIYDYINELPEKFETKLTIGGANFSGGQRQCIAIARAMLNNPDYLLLDEATSNLDTHNEHMVLDALKELMQGRTTVVIAHSLAAIKNADHVIVLRDGKTDASGSPEEILRQADNYLDKIVHRRNSKGEK